MAMKAIINFYARLVQKEQMDLKEIPEQYRDEVKQRLEELKNQDSK